MNKPETRQEMLNELATLREMINELEEEKARLRNHLATSRRSLGMFKRVFEASGEGILIMNEELRIQEANPSFCKQLGYPWEDVVDHFLAEFLAKDTRLRLEEHLAEMPAENFHNYEGMFLTSDGRSIPMLVHRTTIYGDQNSILGYACFLRDLTEMKAMQAMREDVERIARHDLKSYLLSTVYIPRILRKNTNLNREQLELLDSLEDSGMRMMERINRSMDLYKMEQGTFQLETQPINLPPLLFKAFNTLGQLRQDKQLRLKVFQENTPIDPNAGFVIHADEMLCTSLLGNLIKNAAEASPQGEAICVRLRESPPWREIEVHNKGSHSPGNPRALF